MLFSLSLGGDGGRFFKNRGRGRLRKKMGGGKKRGPMRRSSGREDQRWREGGREDQRQRIERIPPPSLLMTLRSVERT